MSLLADRVQRSSTVEGQEKTGDSSTERESSLFPTLHTSTLFHPKPRQKTCLFLLSKRTLVFKKKNVSPEKWCKNRKKKHSEHYSEQGEPNKKETTTLICGVSCSLLDLLHPYQRPSLSQHALPPSRSTSTPLTLPRPAHRPTLTRQKQDARFRSVNENSRKIPSQSDGL